MTEDASSVHASDIDRAAQLMIRKFGDTSAILRSRRRANECRAVGQAGAANLWAEVTLKLRDMVPVDHHPEYPRGATAVSVLLA